MKSLAVVLAIACATAELAIVDVASASGTSSEAAKARYAEVAIDASKLGSSGPAIERKLRERADALLRRDGVLPPRDAGDPVIAIAIEEVTGDNPGYAYRVDIVRDGKAPAASKPTLCGLCTETELVTAVGSRIEHAIAKLDEPAAVPPPRIDARATPAQTDVAPLQDAPRPSPALRIAGGSLAGVGAVATIVGAVLAAREPRPKEDMPLEETNPKPPGYALIGVGTAVVVTGAVLLIVDARRRVRAKRSSVARVR